MDTDGDSGVLGALLWWGGVFVGVQMEVGGCWGGVEGTAGVGKGPCRDTDGGSGVLGGPAVVVGGVYGSTVEAGAHWEGLGALLCWGGRSCCN